MAGRHRKPTHTGRNVAVGVASGAFLLPAAGVADARVPEPVASTVDSGTWGVIARCESENRNIENSRSSASGYFQIIDGTWRANGGTQYASRAIGASRAQQQAVAQRIAERRGSLADWNASKGCWGDEIVSAVPRASSSAPSVPPRPRQSAAPQSKAQRATGARAADGSGTYVCDTARLYFDACDPDTLGQVVQYPLYGGRAAAAPSGPVRGATVAALATSAPAAASTSGVVSAARRWIGTPYRYGGTTSAGLDCSALVQNVLRSVGVSAPRTSRAQAAWATPISASAARPGDLVFFYSPVSHVGIYIGDGKMIDAPQPGTTVGVRTVYPGARYGRVPA